MPSIRRVGLVFTAALAAAASVATAPPAHAEDPIVKLVSAFSGKCLQPASLDHGASVIQMSCNGATAQQWTVEGGLTTRSHLRNRASGFCMDAFGPAANGTRIIQWTCNSISNENWNFGITNNLLASRVSNTASHCVATPGTQDGLPMELRFCDGNSSQLWDRPPG